jgi:SpoVK/Ycf46/Vps4 family AAA+-type ATPase
MTEQHIAAAFEKAQEAGAALLIDEVDSFLQDRSKAQRGWEVTHVNEFLTQMEQFSGLFIASTNLIDGFDAAAFRRFDLKAKFDYLKRDQARRLLNAHLINARLSDPSPADLARLDSLDVLTPGDFASVARQSRFKFLRSASEWVEALSLECGLKPATRRHVLGFGGANELHGTTHHRVR